VWFIEFGCCSQLGCGLGAGEEEVSNVGLGCNVESLGEGECGGDLEDFDVRRGELRFYNGEVGGYGYTKFEECPWGEGFVLCVVERAGAENELRMRVDRVIEKMCDHDDILCIKVYFLCSIRSNYHNVWADK